MIVVNIFEAIIPQNLKCRCRNLAFESSIV